MSRTLISQPAQVLPSEAYDDALPAGIGLQTGSLNVQDDLNAIRSQLRRVIHNTESGSWYDPLSGSATPRGINQINDALDHMTGTFSEPQHESLHTLTHFIASSSYEQVTYSGTPRRISSVVTWDSSAKVRKVRESRYTYVGNRVTTLIDVQYDTTGSLKYALTESISYADPYSFYVSSITRTRT
jgi:hypothetical protein